MREAVIASQSLDPRAVETLLLGPVPGAKPVWYQKHMTLHMLPGFALDWMNRVRNAFLIRHPRAVLASYALKRSAVTASDIGFVQQRELFEREADRLGAAPPVVDAADVSRAPQPRSSACAPPSAYPMPHRCRLASGAPRDRWVWAPEWYRSVERSTGFDARGPSLVEPLPPHLQALADEAEPHYEALRSHRITRTRADRTQSPRLALAITCATRVLGYWPGVRPCGKSGVLYVLSEVLRTR